MDRLKAMQVFAQVARTGSFSAAAKQLGLSPPSVTRIIGELEAELGVSLFHRTTRAVRLTETGALFRDQAEQIVQAAAEAFDMARGAQTTPRGLVRITAPVLFGTYYVSPVLTAFLARHEQVRADTVYVDRPVNLVDEGFDIGVRIGHLADSSLRARRVGSVRRVVCASSEFLARRGRPAHPTELADAPTIDARPVSASPRWQFAAGLSVEVASRRSTSVMADAIAVCRAGGGFTQVLSYQIGPDLAAGTLEIVLEDFEVEPLPIHVLHTEGRSAAAKVRLLVEALSDGIGAHPHLAAGGRPRAHAS